MLLAALSLDLDCLYGFGGKELVDFYGPKNWLRPEVPSIPPPKELIRECWSLSFLFSAMHFARSENPSLNLGSRCLACSISLRALYSLTIFFSKPSDDVRILIVSAKNKRGEKITYPRQGHFCAFKVPRHLKFELV